MVRFFIFAVVLLVAYASGSFAQSPTDSARRDAELRGSSPVAAPRTLAERRIDRQRGLRRAGDTTGSATGLPPLPDPFDEFSDDPVTGETIDRSNVFRDLDIDPESRAPTHRSRAWW